MLLGILAAITLLVAFSGDGFGQEPTGNLSSKSGNPLVTALWFSQANAKPEALIPEKDLQLQTMLAVAMHGNAPSLSWQSVREVSERIIF